VQTLKVHYLKLLIFAGMFFLGGAYSYATSKTGPDVLLQQADACRKSLYESVKKSRYRHNWLNCIRLYEKIYTRYPESDSAAWALYHSGGLFTGLYRYSGNSEYLDKAVDLYRELASQYPDHRLADDAQYLIGEIFYRYRKIPAQAYVEYLKVDIRFPSGDMRPKARKMLDKLAGILSPKAEEGSAPESGWAAVKDIRHWSTPNYTRVVVDMGGPVKYEHHLLKADPDHSKPRRFYLDLKNARVDSQTGGSIPIKDGLLLRARAAQYTKTDVRVVLDMASVGSYKVFHLHDPFRIVVDVCRVDRDEDVAASEVAQPPRETGKGIKKSSAPEKRVSLARQLGLNVKRIVIDPGHGGKDPGCIGPGGIKEKDIVLRLAKLLAEKIRKEMGCQVFLTRETDVFLSLEQRTAIANMKKADLFISLHINAHKDRRIWGLETYFLNMATDEQAMMVAARENATSEKNISDLQAILNDLLLNTKINESSRLAHEVQQGMIHRLDQGSRRVKSLGVKQAPFYVLVGAEMPAILVETGFLTNRTERNRLLSKHYQYALAEGIYGGIHRYIQGIEQAYGGG
jgi:N-acetylmuramoyl-L-alanine amidase